MSAAIASQEPGRRIVEAIEGWSDSGRLFRAVEFAPGRWVWRRPDPSGGTQLCLGLYHEATVVCGTSVPANLEYELFASETAREVDPRALEALRWMESFDGARP